jgi:hypothetical protein
VDLDHIKGALAMAREMRSPKFSPATTAGEKISALEDYLLETAWMQGELEEALFWLDSLVSHYRHKATLITGYEVALPNKRRERITQADINTAKRTVDPETFELGEQVTQLRAQALRQIDRMRFEAGQGPISRAYTMVTGG